MMKRNVANLRIDREGHGNKIVERGFVVHRAYIAVELIVHAPKGAEALHHTGTGRTEQVPVHAEQANRSGVQEEVDRLVLGDALLGAEAQRIDPEEGIIVAGSDMGLEL